MFSNDVDRYNTSQEKLRTVNVFNSNQIISHLSSTMIYLLCIILAMCKAALVPQILTFEREVGNWSEHIPEEQNLYPRYFLCGLARRSLQWKKSLSNCQCRKRWYKWKYQTRCNNCLNSFTTMTSGIKAVFCSWTNWWDQLHQVLETKSNKSKHWNPALTCPVGHYVKAIVGILSMEYDTDIGLSGVKIECSDASLARSVILQERESSKSVEFPNFGSFLSSLRIKHDGQKVVGLDASFQEPVVISDIKVAYRKSKMSSSPKTQQIWSSIIENKQSKPMREAVDIESPLSTNCTWRVAKEDFLDCEVDKKAKLSLPSPWRSSYIAMSPPGLAFNQDMQLKGKYSNKLSLSLSECSALSISVELVSSKETMPFIAQLSVVGKYTGKQMERRIIEGVWEGILIETVNVKIDQILVEKTQCPHNLR